MSKRLAFWFRIALIVSILGSPFFSLQAFFTVRGIILEYPNDLQYPSLWGAITALCVLLLPIGLAEVYALSMATTPRRIRTLYKVLEMTCWLGAVSAIVVPTIFCVTQDVGHIAIILVQVTTGSILAAGALLARMCQQSPGRDPFLAE